MVYDFVNMQDVDSGYARLVEENMDPGIRVNYAIDKSFKRGDNLDEKKEAIRTIGDVLEYLKKLSAPESTKQND